MLEMNIDFNVVEKVGLPKKFGSYFMINDEYGIEIVDYYTEEWKEVPTPGFYRVLPDKDDPQITFPEYITDHIIAWAELPSKIKVQNIVEKSKGGHN